MDLDALTSDDDDLSKQLVVKKLISVVSKRAAKSSSTLEVVFNGNVVKVHLVKTVDTDDRTRRWLLDNEIRMLPSSNDLLILRATSGKSRFSRIFQSRPDVFTLAYKAIEEKLNRQGPGLSLPGQSCTLVLEVARGDVEDTAATLLIETELDSARLLDAITDGDSFLQNVRRISSILENIPVSTSALQALEGAIKTLGDSHPLAKAVLTALSIPYKLLKNELKFKQNMRDLAEVMRFTCQCLVDVRYHTKIASAKEVFVSVMSTIRDAAAFMNTYARKSKIAQFVGSQFPKKLESFAEELVTQKHNFQMAMVMQIARDVDMMASMTSEMFLEKRLRPADEQPLGSGCLEGTRVVALRDVRDWLQDRNSSKNIWWIVGAPGAGKSTIATSIAKELADTAPFCAKFFAKRDVPQLHDPRRIWRTIANSLATKHDGLKAALMVTLGEKKGSPKDDSVIEQFQKLILGPLESNLKEMNFRSRKATYPLIIIDGLDEFYPATDDSWKFLLRTLKRWSELPRTGVFKLIVTSRDYPDIRKTLGEVSHYIDLTTGENVSADSKSDIAVFFMKKFAEMREDFSLSPDWPSEEAILAMTDYAAGLFIWADMVVRYVGHRTVARNPSKRLEDVLDDIKPHSGHQRNDIKALHGYDQVDRLYARIIFEAFRDSTSDEREMAKRILAAVILMKEQSGKAGLVELLSADTSDPSDVLTSIDSTLWELSPIIADVNNELRVCHKTVTDFLLSYGRNATAMKSVVESWNMDSQHRKWDAPVSELILNCEEEHGFLSLACVHLVRRKFSLDIGSVTEHLRQPKGLLDYAYQYWFEHLEGAGCERPSSLKSLSDAMKVAYGCLKRYSQTMTQVKDEAVALIICLRDTANFASRCINHDHVQGTSDLELEIKGHITTLGTARGNFQIALVLNLASDIDKSAIDASDAFLLKRLKPSNRSLLDNVCLKDTRASVLSEAKDWLTNPKLSNTLWISGAPGAGKSTIATTLVSEFSDFNTCLCAKVFAKRDFADRRDPRRVWRTLAYDLAGLHVGLKGSIMEALYEKSHSPQTLSVENQFHDLIVKALLNQQYPPVVVVIDALDECFTEDSEDWRTLLQTIAGWVDLPRTFRLVVTSRDIFEIRNDLEKTSYSLKLTTGNKVSIEAKSDIRRFFQTKFAAMASYWLCEDVLQRLTDHAAGSFIWAKMVVEMVKLDPAGRRLEDILDGNAPGRAGHVSIDILYGKVLFETLGQLRQKERKMSRSILAAIVLAKDPLRMNDVVELLSTESSTVDETRHSVEKMVEELSSIISVDNHQRLRIPHKSFSDFLLDYNRSSTAMKQLVSVEHVARSYVIDCDEDSETMAIACLSLMNRSLASNALKIENLEASYYLNDNIPQTELEAFISKTINSSLIYACRFWAEHLRDLVVSFQDDSHLRAVQPHLKKLLCENQNVVHWLDILDFIREIASAEQSLLVAGRFLAAYGDGLSGAVDDARRSAKKRMYIYT